MTLELVILKYPPCPPWGMASRRLAGRILQATGIFATSMKKSVVLAELGVAVARSLTLPTAIVLAVSGDGGG